MYQHSIDKKIVINRNERNDCSQTPIFCSTILLGVCSSSWLTYISTRMEERLVATVSIQHGIPVKMRGNMSHGPTSISLLIVD